VVIYTCHMGMLQRNMDSDFGAGATVENASAPPRPAPEPSAEELDKSLSDLFGLTPATDERKRYFEALSKARKVRAR
jgi:hypothetical protein